MSRSVREIQLALKDKGYNPGPIDGIRGRRTIAAILAFQQEHGLTIDGIVGPRTMALLFKDTVSPMVDSFPWLSEARRKMGLHEQIHRKSLWDWLRSDGGSVGDPAKVPWCGDFVEPCLALTLPDEPLPSNPYWARNWAKFGKTCPVSTEGAIAVFSRGQGGHVGFVTGYDPKKKKIRILGGNQSNKVCEAWLDQGRLLATRWPITVRQGFDQVIVAHSKLDGVSKNEE